MSKSGFIAIVGPTNSGKSTLLNALMGKKISIVSPKAQTTYRGVSGILNRDEGQFVLMDTPGYQNYSDKVARLLNDVADQKASGCDLAVWVFDASKPDVVEQISKMRTRITGLKTQEHSFCVLNKVDKIDKRQLLPMIQAVFEMGLFREILPLSAQKGIGTDRLIEVLIPVSPEGQAHYPKDAVSDRDSDFILSEFVREKIYHATRQELPYSAWIEIEHYPQDGKTKVPTIRAVIHVDSDSRKGILIGKRGEMLKRIGTAARADIEKYLGHQICLKLHVDVKNSWKDDGNFLAQYLELNQ